MGVFVGRSEEQDRFRLVLSEAVSRPGDGPDEAFVVLVQGYGGMGKTTLLRRFADIAAGKLPGSSAGRFTVFQTDWERDRGLHAEEYVEFAGPAIWRILERVRAQLESSAASWSVVRRRRLKGFAAFQRLVTKLPELEAEATRLGLGKQVGRQPVTPEQIAAIVRAGGDIAGLAGVPAPVTGAANAIAGAGAHLATTLQAGRATQIDPTAYRALVDQVDALVTAFTDGLRTLAAREPVVMILDTCELLGGAGPWLRETMRRSGRRVVWVVGTRLEPELLAAEASEARRYEREIHEQRLRVITLHRFDDRTAAGYLERRLGTLPPGLDLDRVVALTQGVPLALHFMAKMLTDHVRTGRPLASLYEEVTPDGTVSTVVARMAERYLHHATYRDDYELHRDLPALYGLALIHVEQNLTGQSHDEQAISVTRDPDLLAALWDVPADQVAGRLRDLARRHDFVHSGNGTLHRDVRDAIRTFLLAPTRRAMVKALNQRAVDHLTHQLTTHRHTGIEGQLADAAWRTTTAALLWHTTWVDPPEGILLLRHLYAPAAVLQPAYARLLLGTAAYFTPYHSDGDRTLLTGLFDLNSSLPRRQTTEAAMNALADAPAPRPPLLHGPAEPYLHLLRAQSADALDLDLTDQVTELHRAGGTFPPLNHRLGDMLNNLGRFEEAEAAYRMAAQLAPDVAAAYGSLGYTLTNLGRFEEAKAAYGKSIELAPGNPRTHRWLGALLLFTGETDRARAALARAGDLPDAELLRWVLDRSTPKDTPSPHTPRTVLAALDAPPPSGGPRLPPFVMAEVYAIASAAQGDAAQAVLMLRSFTRSRRPHERFVRPLYDMLAHPEPIDGLKELIQVWQEIIADDPQAAGPWGAPPEG
ncbi:tetratricopeptide repeat protein [Sphaerisporangium aureirubrum]|uniref:Tetratricopeptide repeat protein n=1 Tax=Sphaerisporangium aureirubrum TaxID=1544736 RepID=A0ABW1NWB5_9ACTN